MHDDRDLGLLAVLPDERAAADVERSLARAGVPAAAVHVGRDGDTRAALMAEMQAEGRDAAVSPQAGVAYPKETVKAMGAIGPIFIAVGALLALPLAAIHVGGVPVWARLLFAALAGAAAGGTIAIVVIPAMSAKDPSELPAAGRGTVVKVDTWSQQAEEILTAAHPIRLDRIGPGGRVVATVATEDDEREGGAPQRVAEVVHDEHHASPTERDR